MENTARFWTLINDDNVKIKLKKGCTLIHTEGGANDEGFSYSTTIWAFDGTFVYRECNTTSRDCDGPGGWNNSGMCHVSQLSKHHYNGINYPMWKDVHTSQRDIYAEQMGY